MYNEVTSFISCTWLGDELDLLDQTIGATTPICQLLVVNSAQDCYKGTVTYKDLDDFRRGSITVDVLNTLIKLGLQGAEYYQGDRIAWKTIFNPNDCQVNIGTFQLGRIPDSEKPQAWTEWMEKTTSQFKILKETQDALTLRNAYLVKDFERMEAVAEDLVIQKINADMVMTSKVTTTVGCTLCIKLTHCFLPPSIKYKELLNWKKRKIRRLASQLEKTKEDAQTPSNTSQQQPDDPSSSTLTTKKSKKRQPPVGSTKSSLSKRQAPSSPTHNQAPKRRKRPISSATQLIEAHTESSPSSQPESQPSPPSKSPMKIGNKVGDHQQHHTASSPHLNSHSPAKQTTPTIDASPPSPPSDDESESDDNGKDLYLTTTRSRLRKHAHPGRSQPVESNQASDTSTTDDEEDV
ncbi:hypothetical protein [Absidia glauca]|uniref:Uncharacterized protein n=1 Tax=Absidia glauca TaxID=4829 RepID=A0A163LV52_ABSGL|nr:hypothetical protein [Absidia glauca]